MRREQVHDGAHLTLEDRKVIQKGIENGATKADIARTIGKDATTIAKEIRKHRKIKPRNAYNRPILCEKLPSCPKKPCVKKCELFEEPKCNRRDKSPGACNKCDKMGKCVYDKYFYDASKADEEYRRDLVDFREGINLTTKERDAIAEVIAPLLKKGQSVHQILSAHPEITQCEKTIYTYIESGVFKDFGVDNFSLKEQVNRKLPKKYKKRKEPANFTGRKYADFLAFRAEHPEQPIVEMDTVYNNPSGPYLQTIIFEKNDFMIGFLHNERTNAAMSSGVNTLQERLGKDVFSRLCPIFLTDRGSEFEMWKMFELDSDGNSRLNIFYCDPMQSSQKPHVENNHNYIRDIIPNSYPMDNLTQADIDLMFSHINSTPRRSLGDKSPYEVFCFMYGDSVAGSLNIAKIARDEVILKPNLIYPVKKTVLRSGI
jgi:IS30 family transposase